MKDRPRIPISMEEAIPSEFCWDKVSRDRERPDQLRRRESLEHREHNNYNMASRYNCTHYGFGIDGSVPLVPWLTEEDKSDQRDGHHGSCKGCMMGRDGHSSESLRAS
jgi:hypothetical protein